MANIFNSRSLENVMAVALPPTPDSLYQDFTLEPAMVRIRASNSASLAINSEDIINSDEPPVNCVVALEGDGILMRKIKRIGVRFVDFSHFTEIINERNDTLYVFASTSNLVRTVVIPRGNWNTPQKLCQALYFGWIASDISLLDGIAISFVTNGTTGTPAGTPVPTDDSHILFNFTSPVYFLSNSPAIQGGASTFGWPVIYQKKTKAAVTNPIFPNIPDSEQLADYLSKSVTSMTVGPMPCRYTRFIDIRSDSLTRWTKCPNATSLTGSTSLIFRLFFPEFQGYTTNPGVLTIGGPTPTPTIYEPLNNRVRVDYQGGNTWTLNPDENIATIAIQIFDEYGELFLANSAYCRRQVTPGINGPNDTFVKPNIWNGGVYWNIAFYCEI